MLVAIALLGCGPDLPDGWEGAERIEGVSQAPCAGNPYEDYDERVEVSAVVGGFDVAYREAHFRCEQDVEAFGLDETDAYRVLVQPIDMHPNQVPDCDCLYDVTFSLETDASTVSLWRRWDALNEPNDPFFVGEGP